MSTISEIKNRIAEHIELVKYFQSFNDCDEFHAAVKKFNRTVDVGIRLSLDFERDRTELQECLDHLKHAQSQSFMDLKQIPFSFIGIKQSIILIPPCASVNDRIIIDPGFHIATDIQPARSELFFFPTGKIESYRLSIGE
jgi:hypothetical protein